MSPLRNGEEVLDERLFATGHKDNTRASHQSSTAITLKEKTESPRPVDALQHPSPENTTEATAALDSQTTSGQLFSVPKDDDPAVTVSNCPPPAPTDGPIPSEKIEPQDEADPYPEGGLRAWLVVLGSFSGMTASFGILNSAGTFQAYLSSNQLAHEPPSAVGWIFSLNVFLTFFCGVQIGPVFDAYGPRWLVFAGTVCLAGGMMGVAESTELWHFLLTYSILCGIGSSLIFTPAIGSIAHFFYRRRGATTGLAATGGSTGGIIFPLMLQRLFPEIGFSSFASPICSYAGVYSHRKTAVRFKIFGPTGGFSRIKSSH